MFPVSADRWPALQLSATLRSRHVASQRSFLIAIRREGLGCVTPLLMVCYVCVFVLISASRKQGAVTSVRCRALLSPRKWTDYLCGGGELSLREERNTGSHEYHFGQCPCARWRGHVSCTGIHPHAEYIKRRPQTACVGLLQQTDCSAATHIIDFNTEEEF